MVSGGAAVPLRPEMIAAAGEVLTRAFFDDPMTVFILPNEERRPRVLPSLYCAAIAHACRSGEAHTTSALAAVALWVPPDAAAMTPDQAIVGTDTLAQQMEADERGQLALLVEQLEALRQRHAPAPHWYLDILGVDPPFQGRGIGGEIIQPVLRRADESGVPCYLETFKERNLRFYEKHGFEILPEEQIDGGPRFWPMLRAPRTDRA